MKQGLNLWEYRGKEDMELYLKSNKQKKKIIRINFTSLKGSLKIPNKIKKGR